MGVKSKTIHSLSQALGTGVVFLELQLKEYTAAFFTFRDSIFGSDFYGTTCLHGLHVTTGSTSFGILWCSLNNNEGYKEVHQYQKFWGYYWHLVDSIWISLFMLFYLRIIFKANKLTNFTSYGTSKFNNVQGYRCTALKGIAWLVYKPLIISE